MTTDADIPAKYDPSSVEETILIEAVERHPARLTVDELCAKIVADSDDSREVQTATDAICELRRSGLFDYREGDRSVGPTLAALHACALLAGFARTAGD